MVELEMRRLEGSHGGLVCLLTDFLTSVVVGLGRLTKAAARLCGNASPPGLRPVAS